MNREVKFRFWDSFNGCYTYSDKVQNGLEGFFSLYDAALNGGNNPVLMQYVGLKDKNGKEIYEGDVYKTNEDIYLVTCDETHNGFHWIMIYDSWLNKNVINRNKKSWLSKSDSSKNYEVIGKIYENPELLK